MYDNVWMLGRDRTTIIAGSGYTAIWHATTVKLDYVVTNQIVKLDYASGN